NPPLSDRRVVELVNKTNQFNLNGIRYTEREWQSALDDPESFAMAVSYRDKFGPLGKVAVLRGRREGFCLRVETWVMSCRAFSRRIEHRCLDRLFLKFGVEEMQFAFLQTSRNGPIQEFLSSMLAESTSKESRLTREAFEARC